VEVTEVAEVTMEVRGLQFSKIDGIQMETHSNLQNDMFF
jgi:hypothetical protein